MNQKTKKFIIELSIHMFLVVIVPVAYLEIVTGFNKYRLPEQMPYVNVYWLIYIAVIAIIYGRRQKNKKYKPPKATKKYQDL